MNMARKPLADFSEDAQGSDDHDIVVPPLPTEAQVQQMLQHARERDEHIRREVVREASGPRTAGAGGEPDARSLSEFVDTFYYANAGKAVLVYRPNGANHDIDSQILRNLRKAAIRIAHGPYAKAMRAAAQAWQIRDASKPRAWIYARLKTTMLADKPPLLTANQVTPPVTFICKALRAWLRARYPQACPHDKRAEIKKRKQERLAERERKFQQQALKRQQRFAREERRMLAKMDIAWDNARKTAAAYARESDAAKQREIEEIRAAVKDNKPLPVLKI